MASLPRPAPSLTPPVGGRLVRASPGSAFPTVCWFRLTSTPRAFNVSGALPATLILMAAFRSRSIDAPHATQLNVRSERGSLAFTVPQFEHVLLDGNQRSTARGAAPALMRVCRADACHLRSASPSSRFHFQPVSLALSSFSARASTPRHAGSSHAPPTLDADPMARPTQRPSSNSSPSLAVADATSRSPTYLSGLKHHARQWQYVQRQAATKRTGRTTRKRSHTRSTPATRAHYIRQPNSTRPTTRG